MNWLQNFLVHPLVLLWKFIRMSQVFKSILAIFLKAMLSGKMVLPILAVLRCASKLSIFLTAQISRNGRQYCLSPDKSITANVSISLLLKNNILGYYSL